MIRSNFQQTIQKYCNQLRLKITEINENQATLLFEMRSGRQQALIITNYDSTLEFAVPSKVAQFASEDEISSELAIMLLKRNAMQKIGFWCIHNINEILILSYIHNAELQLINANYFAAVINTLINECDTFEGLLIGLYSFAGGAYAALD